MGGVLKVTRVPLVHPWRWSGTALATGRVSACFGEMQEEGENF